MAHENGMSHARRANAHLGFPFLGCQRRTSASLCLICGLRDDYVQNMPNKSKQSISSHQHRFIDDTASLLIPWGMPQAAARFLEKHALARRHDERGSKRVLYVTCDDYAGLF